MKIQFNRMFDPQRRRSNDRHACRVPGRLILTPRNVVISGLVLDISPFGCRFRPELVYLVQRGGEAVVLEAAGATFAGQIVSTTPLGYGVRFDVVEDVSPFL
jgi:hypothetical protein